MYQVNSKLVILDIDGTLCDINRPIQSNLLTTLQEISQKHQIVLASGKPFGYIAGLIRQLGLDNCMAIGENGGTIMYGASFPPKAYYQIEVSTNVQEIFFKIKQEYSKKFKQTIWFQPNDVNLTVFPLDISKINVIHKFAKEFENSEINTYYHKDSVDFTPKGFDKGTAVDIMLKELNFNVDDLYVFGDGSNDLAMLRKTKNAFLINSKLDGFESKEYFESYDILNLFLERNFIL